MPEHVLKPGVEILEALEALAAPLGYTAVREWRVPGKAAAVDVVWLRRPHDDAPLVAFEVESTASTGLAANVLKLLSRQGAAQPLHLFHLVVEGGIASARPTEVEQAFGSHNYSVHLLSGGGEPGQFLEKLIDVHARVSDQLDGFGLGRLLIAGPWPQELVDPLLRHAQAKGLRGLSERTYALLALASREFRPSLRRKLLELWEAELSGRSAPPNRYLEPPQPREEAYGSYMAAAGCEAIELGLVAALAPQHGHRSLELLARWQELNHIGDRLGENTGSGCQWTEYIVDNIGYYWALVAALMHDVPGARAWCARQPSALLHQIEHASHQPSGLLAVWVMHIASGVGTCEEVYEHARRYLERAGGVDRDWLVEPEPAAPSDEEGLEIVGQGIAPTAHELMRLIRGEEPGLDAIDLALSALIEDPLARPGHGGELAVLLARATETLSPT